MNQRAAIGIGKTLVKQPGLKPTVKGSGSRVTMENDRLSIDAHQAAVAVFEKQPYWGPEFQRQFQHSDIAIRECRSVRDLFPAITEFDSALFVIDLEAGLGDCLDWLGTDVKKSRYRTPIVALGSPDTADLEWILREAGVTAFLPEFITGDDLARLCRRQLNYRR